MNRLSQLLIDLNKQRLPDEYIDNEVVAYIEELKLELGAQPIEDVHIVPTPDSQPVNESVFKEIPDYIRDSWL